MKNKARKIDLFFHQLKLYFHHFCCLELDYYQFSCECRTIMYNILSFFILYSYDNYERARFSVDSIKQNQQFNWYLCATAHRAKCKLIICNCSRMDWYKLVWCIFRLHIQLIRIRWTIMLKSDIGCLILWFKVSVFPKVWMMKKEVFFLNWHLCFEYPRFHLFLVVIPSENDS